MAFFSSCGSFGRAAADLLLHLGNGGSSAANLAARHLAHLVILVVNQHILRLGQIGQRRAVTLRCLDDGLQFLVLLVQLDELLDVGYNLGSVSFCPISRI